MRRRDSLGYNLSFGIEEVMPQFSVEGGGIPNDGQVAQERSKQRVSRDFASIAPSVPFIATAMFLEKRFS
jgi:hypothetical protein